MQLNRNNYIWRYEKEPNGFGYYEIEVTLKNGDRFMHNLKGDFDDCIKKLINVYGLENIKSFEV